MELRRHLALVRRHLLLICVTALAAGTVAWTVTPRTPTYTAEATLYVGSRQFLLDPQTTAFATDRIDAAQRLLVTFARMLDSRVIAAEALARAPVPGITPDRLMERTTAAPIPNTQLLVVAVTDDDPRIAARLANALADAFADAVRAFEPATREGAVPSLPAYVFERATPPTRANPTGAARNVTLGAIFGLVASVALAFLLEYLDVSIRTPADAERHLGLPVLGVIPVLARPDPAFLRSVPGERESA